MFSNKHPFLTALSLALGSAIALGLARFSYGLLLPIMREDLEWSYLVAGTMNTANALGYFIGALSSPAMMRRMSVHHFFISSAIITGIFLFLSGCTDQTSLLFIYRVIAGIASAWIFVAGGVLEVQPNSITVLSDTAIRGKDLDEAKATEAKKAAEEALKNAKSDIDLAHAQSELAVMIAQITALRKYRQKR